MPKLICLAGSSRRDSLNKKLAKLAAVLIEKSGAQATFIDLKDYDMPLYNGDLEESEGVPENAKKLKALFAGHDGFFIAAPEYNSSITPLLKNTLDWISRKHEDGEPPLVAYKNKVAALSAVSPGGLGGLRGLVSLRMMLGNIGVHLTPTQAAINNGNQAFKDDGTLADDNQAKMFQAVIDEFVDTATKLS